MRTIKQTLHLNKAEFSILKEYSTNANSLYNCAVYLCRKYFEETNSYIGLSKLDKEMQLNKHYKAIPSFNAQQIIRLVDQNYRSFFALLKKKLQGQYASEVSYRNRVSLKIIKRTL